MSNYATLYHPEGVIEVSPNLAVQLQVQAVSALSVQPRILNTNPLVCWKHQEMDGFE